VYRRDLRDTSVDGLLADAATADAVVQAAPVPGRDALATAVAREGQVDLWLLDRSGGGTDATRLTGRGVLAMRYGRGDQRWFHPAPDGSAVAFLTADGDVATVDLETGVVERATTHDDPDLAVAWSPDGEDLAVVTDHFSRASLALADPGGGRLEALADDEFLYGDPWWDGERVVATRSTHRDLFDYGAALVRADRDGVEALFAEDAVRVQNPRPRPGNDEVAFVHDGSGFDAVYATDGDGVRQLAAVEDAEVADPAWRADGDALAVTVTTGPRAHVHLLNDVGAAGGRDAAGDLRRVTEGKAFFTAPRFDGDELLAVGETAGHPPAVQSVHDGDAPVDDAAPVPGRRVSPWTVAGLDDRIPTPETITYDSGDREIEAVVYPPADDAAPGSVPALVKPHGGPTAFDRFRFDWRAGYLAALGYAVVLPNYRGSDGYGRAFRMANDRDWGGGDLDDVVAAADALADAYDAVDGDRAGIYGGSGGGLMTVNALGRTDRFDAGAAFYGVYDYESFVDDTDDVGWQLMKRELGDLATDVENYRDASPMRHVETVEAPLLVLHGEEDARVPTSQSEQLVEQLEAHGKRHELQRYDDEPHGFGGREAVVDAYTRVADLFAKYLRVDPDDGTSQPHPPE
jgi:dipeptidyl aminopeptidase/acylaminoacyl peptidase